MAAEFAMIRFQKLAGSNATGSISMPGEVSGQPGFAFYGLGGSSPVENIGYVATPNAGNALQFPVGRGSTSWEVWVAMRFNGFAFGAITAATWYIESIDATGLGTIPDGGTVAYEVPRGTSPIDRTGLVARVHAGPIEKRVDPLDTRLFIPTSAPRFGLPQSDDAIPMMRPGVGFGLDLTPLQSSDSLAVDPGAEIGQRVILEGNPEPRYSNLAVMTMVLADDALPVAQARNPFVFGATWLES